MACLFRPEKGSDVPALGAGECRPEEPEAGNKSGLIQEWRSERRLLGMTQTNYVPQKVTLLLSNLHIAWLDEIGIGIRSRTGAVIRRSSLVRAMLKALNQANLDLSLCKSEEEIRETILACLKRGRDRLPRR